MKLSKEELKILLCWGNAMEFDHGLSDEDEKLYTKIYNNLYKECETNE